MFLIYSPDDATSMVHGVGSLRDSVDVEVENVKWCS